MGTETRRIYETERHKPVIVTVDDICAQVERVDDKAGTDAPRVTVLITSQSPAQEIGPFVVSDNDQLGDIVQAAAHKAGLTP